MSSKEQIINDAVLISGFEFVAEFSGSMYNRCDAKIYRNSFGKWYVTINGTLTQRRLNAKEIVRYLANSANRG